MLRFLVLLVLLVATPCTYAQRLAAQPELPRDLVTGMVSYRRVVVAEGISREQLYNRALAWVRQRHHAPAGMPPLAARSHWTIVAPGEDTISIRGKTRALVRHTLTFGFRDERFQYEFTDFSAQPFGRFENNKPGGSKRTWNRLRINTDAAVKTWVTDLERTMTAKENSTVIFR
jgi:hypothetical protein